MDKVENISGGVKEEKPTEEPSLLSGSQITPTKKEKSTKKTEELITKADALTLLQSALDYMREAGFVVKGENEDSLFILFVDGVQYDGVGKLKLIE